MASVTAVFSRSDDLLMLMFNMSVASSVWNLYLMLLWHMNERVLDDGGVMLNIWDSTFAMEMLFILFLSYWDEDIAHGPLHLSVS